MTRHPAQALIALVTAGLTLTAGCAANSYKIPRSELTRLSTTPPEQRGRAVLVSQEIGGSDVEPADRVESGTQIVFLPDLQVGVGGGYRGDRRGHYTTGGIRGGGSDGSGGVNVGSPGGGSGGKGGGSGGKLGGGGGDGKGAAIAILVIAAVALVAIGVIEASRFDGHVELSPMHPVHLIGQDGRQIVVPLAWLDPETVAFTRTAVIRPTEGPWRQLDRSPLTRGATYGMYTGWATTRSAYGDVDSSTAFTVQAGYFPTQQIGILGSMAFAWRDNVAGGTLFDSRYMLELQALPVKSGRLHAGFYAGAGAAYRWEDVVGGTVGGNNGSTAYQGGAMLQLDLHTRVALTARLGAVRAHDDRMTDIQVGLSIY